MNNDTAVLHRNLLVPPPVALTSFSTFIHGTRDTIDVSSGAGNMCLGYHGFPINWEIGHQLTITPFVHAANWTTDATEELARQILNRAGGHFKNGGVMFLNTGAEAVEGACKLAMQYQVEGGYQGLPRFIAREHAYHGATVFTLCLGDHPRKYKYPLTGNPQKSIIRTAAYMPGWSCPSDSGAYRSLVLTELSRELSYCAARGEQAIVVIEPIGGTAIAIEPADGAYLLSVRAICNDYGALLIYDEVLCGNYRTGSLFAYQAIAVSNVEPDIICMGKGLTAGYYPLSAVVVSEAVRERMRKGSGTLWHTSTNQNHPVGCAAGLAAFAEYDRVLPTAFEPLCTALDDCAAQLSAHRRVLKVTGMGALRGVRLLLDRAGSHTEFRQRLLTAGVSAYTDGATVNGDDNMLLLAPAYNIDLDVLRHATQIILTTLETM